MGILNYILLSLGTITLVISIWFLKITVGFRKNNTGHTSGYLENTKHSNNVYSGGKAGRWYKNWVDFCYSYTVNGKQYKIEHGLPGKPNNLPNVVKIVYQKNKPKYSYIKELTVPIYPIIAILLGILSILYLIPGLFL